MEIPKYLDPNWVIKLKSQCRDSRTSKDAITSGITIKLKNPAGEINDYYITRTTSFKDSYAWVIYADMVNVPTPGRLRSRWNRKVRLFLKYDISNDKLSIINSTDGYDQGIREGEYDIVGDINEEWKLQLARMRLSLAMSLNEKFGLDLLLNNVPEDIIRCIAEKIKAAVGERPLIGDNDGEVVEDYDSDDSHALGGGYTFKYKKKRKSKKKKRKSKRKKRKTKKRKSKRNKHKTKRRK